MQHPDETLAKIRLENEMKHVEHTLETYVYSHCNMCNIMFYFYNINIQMKHMKHLKHKLVTSVVQMSPCYLDEVPEQRGQAGEGERRDR